MSNSLLAKIKMELFKLKERDEICEYRLKSSFTPQEKNLFMGEKKAVQNNINRLQFYIEMVQNQARFEDTTSDYSSEQEIGYGLIYIDEDSSTTDESFFDASSVPRN